MIDLRSDTVTRPTAEMRRAMAEAEVGDDVYGEDPTVNHLETQAAEIFGKQAGLFVPSGTMGNTIAVKLHTTHGQEVICEEASHVMNYELSMLAWFSGCLARPVRADRGILRWEHIRGRIRPHGPHWAPTGVVVLENTHNMAGGTVTPPDVMREVCDRVHELGLKVHLDGARIFNAAAFLGVSVRDLAAHCDTVMFCLSKGLGAPVGSLLVGPAEAIERGRLYRKRLGGGMRQAGVLAAAGWIALERMPARLGEDHRNARFLAEELNKVPGLAVDMTRVETNILLCDVSRTGLPAARFSALLKARGVLANPTGPAALRMVTHFDVSRGQCTAAVEACREIASAAYSSGSESR